MAGGFAIDNDNGGFAFKVDPDGNVKVGDEASDFMQVTGSLSVQGLEASVITENNLGANNTSAITPVTSFHVLDASTITGQNMMGQLMHTLTLADGTIPGQLLDIAIPTSFGPGGNVGIMLAGNVYPSGTSFFSSLPSMRLRWVSISGTNTWIKIGT
tara:strand:- start:1200 stop:1670 length:471 start_codon:yes stop_codon:yes gene_type:complete